MTALYRLAAVALLLVLAFAAGWTKGRHAEQLAQQGQQLRELHQVHQEYAAGVAYGQRFAAGVIAEQQALKGRYGDLQRRFKDALKTMPLTVAPSVGSTTTTVTCPDGSGHQVVLVPLACPDDPPLSLGALWMWNSALAGANVPAGACGAAATPEPACAIESGRTVDDAWANHTLNAATCAADRLNHDRLIDYIERRQKGTP